MSRCEGSSTVRDASSMLGPPTRRRLLALLTNLPVIAMQSNGAEQRRIPGGHRVQRRSDAGAVCRI